MDVLGETVAQYGGAEAIDTGNDRLTYDELAEAVAEPRGSSTPAASDPGTASGSGSGPGSLVTLTRSSRASCSPVSVLGFASAATAPRPSVDAGATEELILDHGWSAGSIDFERGEFDRLALGRTAASMARA